MAIWTRIRDFVGGGILGGLLSGQYISWVLNPAIAAKLSELAIEYAIITEAGVSVSEGYVVAVTTAKAVTLVTATSVVAIGVASGAGGALVGGYVEDKVTQATGSRPAGVATGTLAGAATGAVIGAAIGAAFGGVGAGPGAVIGGVIGGIGGLLAGLF